MNQEDREQYLQAFGALGDEAFAERSRQPCPLPDRWFTVYLGQGKWDAAERQHLASGCPICAATRRRYEAQLGPDVGLERLQAQLQPFLGQLRALVRRRRAGYLRGKVDT